MKVNRKDLLRKLLCVEPGISKKETIHQSSCVVLRRGRFYSLSTEIACSITSGLPTDIEGAVRAEKLIAMLESYPDDEIDLDIQAKTLSLKGTRRRTNFPMEDVVLLPVSEVELPDAKNWQKLHLDYSEAVSLVHRCTTKNSKPEDGFIKTCVHIHPEFLEASDAKRFIRFPLPNFVQKPLLMRGETIKVMCQLGMTKGQETESWLHFRNPMGLRLSLRKITLEGYPDFSPFLEIRGKKVKFPKGLAEVAMRAGILEDEQGDIKLSLTKEKILVNGKSVLGEHEEECATKYLGEPISFMIEPKLIGELIDQGSETRVSDTCLRVDGDKFVYLTSLEIR